MEDKAVEILVPRRETSTAPFACRQQVCFSLQLEDFSGDLSSFFDLQGHQKRERAAQ